MTYSTTPAGYFFLFRGALQKGIICIHIGTQLADFKCSNIKKY